MNKSIIVGIVLLLLVAIVLLFYMHAFPIGPTSTTLSSTTTLKPANQSVSPYLLSVNAFPNPANYPLEVNYSVSQGSIGRPFGSGVLYTVMSYIRFVNWSNSTVNVSGALALSKICDSNASAVQLFENYSPRMEPNAHAANNSTVTALVVPQIGDRSQASVITFADKHIVYMRLQFTYKNVYSRVDIASSSNSKAAQDALVNLSLALLASIKNAQQPQRAA